MPPLTSPQTVKGAGFLLRARWGREGGRVIYMKPMSHLPGETPPPPHTSMASTRPCILSHLEGPAVACQSCAEFFIGSLIFPDYALTGFPVPPVPCAPEVQGGGRGPFWASSSLIKVVLNGEHETTLNNDLAFGDLTPRAI